MHTFYTQISAPQMSANPLVTRLVMLTRLTREQIKLLAGDGVWNSWSN